MQTPKVHTSREVLGESGLAWQKGFIKFLGIQFGSDLRSTLEHNEKTLLEKISAAEAWSPKFITWWGRIETIKMMLTPMVNYVLTMLPLNLSEECYKKNRPNTE